MRGTSRSGAFMMATLISLGALAAPVDAHYNGKLKVTGSGSTETSVARADGTDFEGYCDSTVVKGAKAPVVGGTVSIEVSALGPNATSVDCQPFAKLDPGVYAVFVYDGVVYDFNRVAPLNPKLRDCLGGRFNDPGWFKIGEITVDIKGDGSASGLPLPAGLQANAVSGEHSGICITNLLPGPFEQEDPLEPANMDLGNQAPLKLI